MRSEMARYGSGTVRTACLAAALAATLPGGCGGAPEPDPVEPAPMPDEPAAAAPDGGIADAGDGSVAPCAAPRPRGGMNVRGITGSLNRGDVHQVMETREDALMACVQKRPRRFRWIGGAIDFHIEVDGQGRATDVQTVRSTIGYLPLEQCLTEVIEQTPLPAPDGRDRTELEWGMNVEPSSRRGFDDLDPAELMVTLEQYAGDTYKNCGTPRRARFEVTAYLSGRGRVLAASAVPRNEQARESLECVVGEIMKWKGPRVKRYSKATFSLRWLPPPKKQKHARTARRKKPSKHRRKSCRRR